MPNSFSGGGKGAPAPLSRSTIWSHQRRYFARAGIEAWRQNIVPSYVTSNPVIAHSYAEILCGHVADLRARGEIDEANPLQIIELGAGSGRFAHFLLHALTATARPLPVRYIMTDISRANVAFWRAHPGLRRFVEDGRLDFARFDPVRDTRLHLDIARTTLARHPVAVIANYVLDGIEHDVFRTDHGRLQEGRVTLEADGPVRNGRAPLDEVALRYRFGDCDANYYADPEWNAILADYAGALQQGAFSFPVAALRLLANLRALSGNRLLLLAADKGKLALEDFHRAAPPQPVGHGSISFGVNFHALAAWTRRQGGLALLPDRKPDSIAVVGLAFGAADDRHPELAARYDAHVRGFGPDAFFTQRRNALNGIDALGMPDLLSLLHLSRSDPTTLVRCYDRLVALLPAASAAERQTLRAHLLAVWQHYLPLDEEVDLAFCLGSLLAGIGDFDSAVMFFHDSLARYGDDPAALENLAKCKARVMQQRPASHAQGAPQQRSRAFQVGLAHSGQADKVGASDNVPVLAAGACA